MSLSGRGRANQVRPPDTDSVWVFHRNAWPSEEGIGLRVPCLIAERVRSDGVVIGRIKYGITRISVWGGEVWGLLKESRGKTLPPTGRSWPGPDGFQMAAASCMKQIDQSLGLPYTEVGEVFSDG